MKRIAVIFACCFVVAFSEDVPFVAKKLSKESRAVSFELSGEDRVAAVSASSGVQGIVVSSCPSDSAVVKSPSPRKGTSIPGVEVLVSREGQAMEAKIELSSISMGNSTVTATVLSDSSVSLAPGKGGEIGLSRVADGSFEIAWFAAACSSAAADLSEDGAVTGDVSYKINLEAVNEGSRAWREWNPMCASRSIEAGKIPCQSPKQQQPRELRHSVSGLLSNTSYRVNIIADFRGGVVAYRGAVVRPVALAWMTNGQRIKGEVDKGALLSFGLCVRNAKIGRPLQIIFESTGGDPDLFFTSSVPLAPLSTAEPPTIPPLPWKCEIGLYSLRQREELLLYVGKNSVPPSSDCIATYYFTAFSPGGHATFELTASTKEGDIEDPLNDYFEAEYDANEQSTEYGTAKKDRGIIKSITSGLWDVLAVAFRILLFILENLG